MYNDTISTSSFSSRLALLDDILFPESAVCFPYLPQLSTLSPCHTVANWDYEFTTSTGE